MKLYLLFFVTLCVFAYREYSADRKLADLAWRIKHSFAKDEFNPSKVVPGFVVVGIFKDEAMTITEWVSHYRWQGALHFYLIDNGSRDDWRSKVVAGREEFEDMTVVTNEEKHKQIEHYNTYLSLLREKHAVDWALVVDIDEYLYPNPSEKNLASYFASVPWSVDQVSVAWKQFGSSGLRLQPKSIRCSFVLRGYNVSSQIKSAIRISRLGKFAVHLHEGKPQHQLNTKLEERLQLNHYPIQSREYFEKVKMNRGDVATKVSDQVRSWDYFIRYDDLGSKQRDTELCHILNCCNITLLGREN